MNQGIYFNLHSSALEGFRFMTTWFNISETLTSELNNLKKQKKMLHGKWLGLSSSPEGRTSIDCKLGGDRMLRRLFASSHAVYL